MISIATYMYANTIVPTMPFTPKSIKGCYDMLLSYSLTFLKIMRYTIIYIRCSLFLYKYTPNCKYNFSTNYLASIRFSRLFILKKY